MTKPLENRSITEAAALEGPRVYSTDLLPNFFVAGDVDESVETAGRALKVKIITKGLVTLNGIHLFSPLGVHLLDQHADLLDGDALLPAFREDHDSFEVVASHAGNHAAAGIDAARLKDHIQRVEAQLKRAMPWSLGNTAERYRRLILGDLKNEDSIVSRQLGEAGLDRDRIKEIAEHVAGADLKQSAELNTYVDALPETDAREPIRRFLAACYHNVGTSVVNSEAGADLSPLSHFRAADLQLASETAAERALSDETIFLDMFMTYALETIQCSAMPTWIIDGIDFKTAHQLGAVLREKGFAEKYDRVVRDYLRMSGLLGEGASIGDLEVEQVAWMARELRDTFEKSVIAELPNYTLGSVENAKDAVIKSRTEVIRGIGTELIPGLSNIVNVAEWMKKVTGWLRTEAELRSINDGVQAAHNQKAEEIGERLRHLRNDKAEVGLLDAVRAMSEIQAISTKPA